MNPSSSFKPACAPANWAKAAPVLSWREGLRCCAIWSATWAYSWACNLETLSPRASQREWASILAYPLATRNMHFRGALRSHLRAKLRL